MVIFGGISLLTFIFFEESFRKERSLAYLSAKKRAIARQQGTSGSWFGSKSASRALSRVPSKTEVKSPTTEHMDIEAGRVAHGVGDPTPIENDNTDVKLTIADVNPLGPAWQVLQQKSNITILFASAVCFGFNYGICYTAAITFAEAPYSYNALEIGCILLALGMGSVGGSVLGGRWSDIILSRLKAKNGGVSQPEMRLKSTIIALTILPFSVIGYAWMCHAHIHVAGPIVMLVISGFALMWGYSSMLAYIVDSNPGRASSAIAMNSAFRGVSGLVAAEASQPIQNAIGDGGLYSIWAGLLFGVVALVIVTAKYGETWRAAEEKAHFEKRMKEAESGAIEKC
ncbi:hypothetical protein FRC02_004021 [Tulasnella sp. 418]|nr:hypothetical protein FRC02_004021 [Tulasnella sp. 418]